jgi:hypothetical protein
MTTTYISGPMTNIAAFNFPTFDSVETALAPHGHVYSPAQHDRQVIERLWPGRKPEDFDGYAEGDITRYFDAVSSGGEFVLDNMMKWDINTIVNDVDRIVLLPGWEKSTGARTERHVAEAVGKEVWLAVPDPWNTGYWLFEPDEEQRRTHGALATLQPTPTPVIEQDPVIGTLGRALPGFTPGVIAQQRILTGTANRPYNEADQALPRPARTPEGDRLYGADHLWPKDEGEERIVDPLTGGEKGRKLARWDLLPPDALLEIAEHYGRGARKYADRNWEKGYAWGLSISSLQNHHNAFLRSETFDADGFRHSTAVAWHAICLLTYELRGIGTDDRPVISSAGDGSEQRASARDAVMQALGEASVCWSDLPQGVFDSVHAIGVGERLLAELGLS